MASAHVVAAPRDPSEPTAVRRARGDEGAALLEAAIVTLPLFVILLGIFEFGLVMKDYLAISNGVRGGARMASVQANQADADYKIIQEVKSETLALPRASIVRLVVFKANPAAGNPPLTTPADATCLTKSAHDTSVTNCNIYSPSQDWDPTTTPPYLNYNCGSPGWSKGFCPDTRKAALGPPPITSGLPNNSPPDYVGIYLEINHTFVTRLFGSARTLTSELTVRIEPKSAY